VKANFQSERGRVDCKLPRTLSRSVSIVWQSVEEMDLSPEPISYEENGLR